MFSLVYKLRMFEIAGEVSWLGRYVLATIAASLVVIVAADEHGDIRMSENSKKPHQISALKLRQP
jgi:hypothetical protein